MSNLLFAADISVFWVNLLFAANLSILGVNPLLAVNLSISAFWLGGHEQDETGW